MATKAKGDRDGLFSESTLNLVLVLGVYFVSYYAYLGGPLAVAQAMKAGAMDEYLTVFTCFGPLILLAWGVLALRQGLRDAAGRVGVIAGVVGGVALAAMTVYGLGHVPQGVPPALSYRGPALVLGFGYPVVYAAFAFRFLRTGQSA